MLYIAIFLIIGYITFTARPSDGGLVLFNFVRQPELAPVRMALVCAVLWLVALIAVHVIRRLQGHTMLEIGADRIVFQGLFRREIPIDQIERIDDFYGSMLIRSKNGRPVRIPVLLAADFYGIKRTLERMNERIQSARAQT